MTRRAHPRILYCTDTYPPQVNGVSVVTAVSVAGIQERGWECAVIAPKYPKPYGKAFASDAPGLASVRVQLRLPSIAFPPYPDIRLVAPRFGSVYDTIREFEPDLVHCQTEFLVGRLGQMAASRLDVPLVSSYHTDFSRYTESYGVPWLRPAVTNYIARFHQRSRRVYTPSEPARDDLARMGVHGVEVWGRGVDVKQFNPGMWSGALREQLGVDDELLFLHVGRLAPEKGVEVVLDAYRLFREQNADVPSKLVIAGDGPSTDILRARAGGGEGVEFLGNLERRLVLPLLYASADAFVYASETETLGLVVLEAMASGIPVIATPAGGVADNLRHDVNGLAFPARDVAAMAQAMARIARDGQLRRRLADGARAWAESKSWDAELDRLDASYREVMRSVASSETPRARAERRDRLRHDATAGGYPTRR
jgi:glycosyltransferase involved in cell wall biosynthesis